MLILVVIFVQGAVWIYSPGGSDPSLVGYWKLDGNAQDSSGNANHGTVTGATKTNKGKFKGAYEFDGENNKITTSAILTNFEKFPYSVSVWFNTNTVTGNGILVNHGLAGSKGFGLLRVTNTLQFSYYNNTGGYIYGDTSTDTFTTNTWHHAVATFDGTDEALYLDGVEQADTATPSPAFGISAILDIGGYGPGGAFSEFNGTIDEVRIYNRSLTAAEVRELYNESKISHKSYIRGSGDNGLVNNTGIVGWWDLNGDALDKSGEGNDGTVTGATKTNKGKYKGAYEFDGVDDYINLGTSQDFNLSKSSNGQTVSFWAYPKEEKWMYAIEYVLGRCEIGHHTAYATSWYMRCWNFWEGFSWGPGTDTWELNKWHYITVVANGTANNSEVRFYHNGILTNTKKYNLTETYPSINPKIASSRNWNGAIDEVMIFNRSLSASEIRELYNESKVSHKVILKGSGDNGLVNNTGIVGWWDLNGDATDKSGEGNDGTVTGAVLTNKGKYKGAYEFDGFPDTILLMNYEPPTTGYTISAWAKTDSCNLNTRQAIVMSDDYNGIGFRDVNGGKCQVFSYGYLGGSGGGTGYDYDPNTWYHVALVSNGNNSNHYIFVNGVNTTTLTNVLHPKLDWWRVGIKFATWGFDGIIDEVMIFNRSLSADEILELYNESKTSHKISFKGSPDAN